MSEQKRTKTSGRLRNRRKRWNPAGGLMRRQRERTHTREARGDI